MLWAGDVVIEVDVCDDNPKFGTVLANDIDVTDARRLLKTGDFWRLNSCGNIA